MNGTMHKRLVISDQVLELPHGRIAVVRERGADLETPLSVYLKLRGEGASFLLESVSGGEQVARFSFIGVWPKRAFVFRHQAWHIHSPAGIERIPLQQGQNPFELLREVLHPNSPIASRQINHPLRFLGGLVGYLGYDFIRYFEPTVAIEPRPDLPEAIFLEVNSFVAFDHAFGKLMLVCVSEGEEQAVAEAVERLDALEKRLLQPLPQEIVGERIAVRQRLQPLLKAEQFEVMVRRAQDYIRMGDCFQIVLSQRFLGQTQASPLSIYRSLRRLNPSPYLYHFDFADLAGELPFHLIGASPEMHVRLERGVASLRPIAGTRPRADKPEEDARLEKELLADPKERAEHIMLVDLARNDLGRVCHFGTVRLSQQMVVERYSHVMHIVSQVDGELREDLDAFDLLQATFPAGTVSGAPKVRAMQVIHELEKQSRGVYAGVVGYFSYNGELDSCIAIRTIVMLGNQVEIQAGAGIVADSEASREHQECFNKANALFQAVELAEQSLPAPTTVGTIVNDGKLAKVVLIDNYDSFTYNLAQYLGELGAEVLVFRNDALSVDEVAALHPTHLVISPGPGAPHQAGISNDVILQLGKSIPTLGVCLGHQCIGHAFGGKVLQAPILMHGKTSLIYHNGDVLFRNVPSPFEATRYHSLIVSEPLPSDLEVTARTEDGIVMGLRHKHYPIFGVQFHPESILTSYGKQILENFLALKQPSSNLASFESSKPKGEMTMLKPYLAKIVQRKDLSLQEAEEAMTLIMTGQATDAQIGAFLVGLRMKGETIDEIVGCAKAMRAQAMALPNLDDTVTLFDTAGTGGDGKHSFNISTAAAFVIAGAGYKVAKHGNRAVSSTCGSADLLAALGIQIDLTPEQVAHCIREVGIGFLFAPRFHPAMKFALKPRREIGQRSIFNMLGPLVNPARVTHQLIGVYDPSLTELLAQAALELGNRATIVVHGAGGLDELTTNGKNLVTKAQDGKLETFEVDAQTYGLRPAREEDLRGGTPEQNAQQLRELLQGKVQSPCRDVVLFNAAMAISMVTGDLPQALQQATQSLDSGAALQKLEQLIASVPASAVS
jgi:anthranilate phosphoribosyltransferase